MVLIAELATPFLLPFTPRVRRLAFFPVLFLALRFRLDGGGESVDRGFSPALVLWVLDDAAFPKRLGGTLLPAPPEIPLAPRLSLGRKVALGLYSLVLGVTSLGFFFGLLGFQPLGAAGNGVYRAVYPLRSFNAYLPERAIPSDRLGLVLEGTRDGREWKPYRFRRNRARGPAVPPWLVGPCIAWTTRCRSRRGRNARTLRSWPSFAPRSWRAARSRTPWSRRIPSRSSLPSRSGFGKRAFVWRARTNDGTRAFGGCVTSRGVLPEIRLPR
jgi:hypothetical protein